MREHKIFIKRKECERFDHIMHTFPGPLFIYDTETTGVNPNMDYIIQFAAIRLDRGANGQYCITQYFNRYIRPPYPVPDAASKVNHITNEFLENKKTEPEVFPEIRKFLEDAENGYGIVIGYNNHKFDDIIVSAMYQRQAGKTFMPVCSIDAKIMAEEIVRRNELPNQMMTLSNVAGLYGVLQENMHNAITDIRVTGAVLFRLFEDYLYHFKTASTSGKPKIQIVGMYRFKKSKTVNYIIISCNILNPDGNVVAGKARYDVWNKCYENVEGDLLEKGDFDQFVLDANAYAGGDIAKYK